MKTKRENDGKSRVERGSRLLLKKKKKTGKSKVAILIGVYRI